MTSLVLNDTYGAAILPDTDTLDMKVTYADGSENDALPSIPIKNENIDISQPNKMIITLTPYIKDGTTLSDETEQHYIDTTVPFEIEYTTKIDNHYISNIPTGTSPPNSDFTNSVFAEYQLETLEGTKKSASASDYPTQNKDPLLSMTSGGYDHKTRALTWNITINPAGLDLNSVVFEDRFFRGQSTVINDIQKFENHDAQIKEIEDKINNQINNLPDGATADVSLKIEKNDDGQDEYVLHIELKNTGTTTISFNYKTYSTNPSLWAGNISNRNYTNSSRISDIAVNNEDDTQTELGYTITSSAQTTVSGQVLRKWPMSSYQTDEKQLQWEIRVNERGASLGDITIVDTIPAGMSYVPNSSFLLTDTNENGNLEGNELTNQTTIADGDETADYYVIQDGNKLIFYLKDIDTYRSIRYDLAVDVNSDAFADANKNNPVKFDNTAELYIKPTEDSDLTKKTASANKIAAIKFDTLSKTPSRNGQKVDYTVQINPLQMELLKDGDDELYLEDTLDEGLILDESTIKLYKGTESQGAKDDNPYTNTHTYTIKVGQGALIDDAKIEFDSAFNRLRVYLDDTDSSYYLTYTAYITRANIALKNDVCLVGSKLPDKNSESSTSVEYEQNSGGSISFLPLPPGISDKYFTFKFKVTEKGKDDAIAGAEIGIYTGEDESKLIAKSTTDSKGVCSVIISKDTFDFEPEFYYKQLSTASGYLLGEPTWESIEPQESDSKEVSLENSKAEAGERARLVVTRQDEDTKEPLVNAVFTLYEWTGEGDIPENPSQDNLISIKTATTNLYGQIIFDGLDESGSTKYYLVETDPPEGYEPVTNEIIEITGDGDDKDDEGNITIEIPVGNAPDEDTDDDNEKPDDNEGDNENPDGNEGDNENPDGNEGDNNNNSSSGSGGGSTTPVKPDETKEYTIKYMDCNGYCVEYHPENGTVTLDRLPFLTGYIFTGWYLDEDRTIPVTSLTMTQDYIVYPGWRKYEVPDMLNDDDHFAYVVGYPEGDVRPLDNITRAEVAAIFFRLLEPNIRDNNLTSTGSFTDVLSGMWHNTAIDTMEKLGLVYGRSETLFEPDAPITRAEFAAIAARFDTSPITLYSNFTDISGHWAEDSIKRAATLGWVQGYPDGTFRPDQLITRAEAMTLINHMLLRLPETNDDLHSDMIDWPDNQPNQWYYLMVQEATNSHDYIKKDDGIYETWQNINPIDDWFQYMG